MKVWIKLASGAVRAMLVEHKDHAVFCGACPACAHDPLRAAGSGRRVVRDRVHVADGHCVDCGAALGTIYAKPATLFGIAEDEAVLHGRARVYGGER